MRSRLAGVILLMGAACAACSSPERGHPAGRHDAETSAVESASTARVSSASRAENPATSSRRSWSGDDSSDARPLARGSSARGSGSAEAGAGDEPPGPEAVGSPRARRERIVEEAANEDRPAGRSEARFEADGASWKPGVGFLPRYTLRSIDRTAGPAPDPIIEKAIPGSQLDLPPPEPPKKKPEVQKAAEQPTEAPRPVVPRPVD